MGFCLFNNVAVGASAALAEHAAERVLVVDWDLHHGNGTQEIFYEDPRVFYLSLHRFPFWPGTGAVQETGRGRGLGFTMNVPLRASAPRREIRQSFSRALAEIASRFVPQLVMISSGFDMQRADPLGGLSLEARDFGEMTYEVGELFLKRGAAGIVSTLEGGYNLDTLGTAVVTHALALQALA
jgi:acetoin utilization deacetylase AcuC-like enzyme